MKRKIILLTICLAALCGEFGFWWQQHSAQKQAEQLTQAIVNAATAPTEEPQTEEAPMPEVTPKPNLIPIDFAAIQAEYSDIYAWLTIPNTDINYPIFQHPSDDTFYLEHNADGSIGRPGCIYSEKWNSKDLTDRNTILYGHDMNDLTMFGTLQYFREENYLAQHPVIWIYTPEKALSYTIFAQVIVDDRYLPHSFDFSSQEGLQEYLSFLQTAAQNGYGSYNGAIVSSSSRLLTLSTCVDGMPSSRYLVVARYSGEDSGG